MGLILANDILMDVSYVLVSAVVNTTNIGTTIDGGTVNAVTVSSVVGMYPGAQIVVGANGSGTQEVVTIATVGPGGFTALFVNNHPVGEPIFGATFPEGQPDHILFTQAEMLAYLVEVENDFLLKTRCIYNNLQTPLTPASRFYAQSADAVRLERIGLLSSVATVLSIQEVQNSTQTDLDLENSLWEQENGPPQQWFQDQIDTAEYGFYPLPIQADTIELFYSQKDVNLTTLLSPLLVPDILSHYMKYGVLARASSKDGEQKNPLLTEFTSKVYDYGIFLTQRFMNSTDVPNPKEAIGTAVFQRFPIYKQLYSG
jgi:hypothetical protein